jgi:hypothetical protein
VLWWRAVPNGDRGGGYFVDAWCASKRRIGVWGGRAEGESPARLQGDMGRSTFPQDRENPVNILLA